MQQSSRIPRAAPWPLLAWTVGSASVAAVCLGLGALASQHWAQPEPGILLTTEAQRAVREGLDQPLEAHERRALEARETPALPAPLKPLAWQTSTPERLPSSTALPSSAVASELTASDAPDLPEQRAALSPGEIERVAGSDGPDAGASDGPANAAAGGASQQESVPPDAEAPQPAPETEQNDAQPGLPGESCGVVTCSAGYACCNPSCGVCVPPGENCDPTPCESRIQYPASRMCGRSTCSVGEVCCNASCGTCVLPGETCEQAPCDNAIQYPFSQSCGRSTCSVGKVCCNVSCGICVSPGETCTQQWCE